MGKYVLRWSNKGSSMFVSLRVTCERRKDGLEVYTVSEPGVGDIIWEPDPEIALKFDTKEEAEAWLVAAVLAERLAPDQFLRAVPLNPSLKVR